MTQAGSQKQFTIQNLIGEHAILHESDTITLGAKLAQVLLPGDVVCVSGELGAGKTVFCKGIAQGLGIDPEEVSSPTFAIVQEYSGQVGLVHADFYRLKDADEARRIGWDEYVDSGRIVMIEWPEVAPELAPAIRWHVHIESSDSTNPNHRIITVNRINV